MEENGMIKRAWGKIITGVLFVISCFATGYVLVEFHEQVVLLGIAAGVLTICTFLFFGTIFSNKGKDTVPSQKAKKDVSNEKDLEFQQNLINYMKQIEIYQKELTETLKVQNTLLQGQVQNLKQDLQVLSEKQANQTKLVIKFNKENARQIAISERETLVDVMQVLKEAIESNTEAVNLVKESIETKEITWPEVQPLPERVVPEAILQEPEVTPEAVFDFGIENMEEIENPETPELLMPEMENPEVPELLIPEMEAPEVSELLMPEMESPEVSELLMPEMEIPEVSELLMPETESPELPELLMPETESPELPELLIPEMESPELSELLIPEFENPEELLAASEEMVQEEAFPEELLFPDMSEDMEITLSEDLIAALESEPEPMAESENVLFPELDEFLFQEPEEAPAEEEAPAPAADPFAGLSSSDPGAMMTPEDIAKLLEAMGNN